MRYSPYAALQQASKEGIPVTISLSTLYRCIYLFNFPVSANQLPMGKRRRRKLACTSTRLACNNLRGESIDKRPAEVMLRKEPGHWEMDLVVGAKGGRKALLVLTERVTRFQHIAKALNMLERQYGAKQFRDVFKTITCDNGSEFLNSPALERSCRSSRTIHIFIFLTCQSSEKSVQCACVLRTGSSVVERLSYTQLVRGSSPFPCIFIKRHLVAL